MFRLQCLLTIVALSIGLANSWDIAITHGDQIEFLSNGTKASNAGVRFKELSALAYDAVHNMLLFVDKKYDNASIFSYNLSNKKFQPLVKKKSNENIQGLSFDPVTSKMFWIDTLAKTIYWMSLAPNSKNNHYGNLLIQMDDEMPRDLAVDSCRGYIYWTNVNVKNPTIERSRFDGTDRKIIVSENLFKPVSISIDQRAKKIYWLDDKEGIQYTLESADLDGQNRQVELHGLHHQPNMMTISNNSFYWIDLAYKSVYKYSKTGKDVDPVIYYKINDDNSPFGIVANYAIADQLEGIPECQTFADMAKNETYIIDAFPNLTKKEVKAAAPVNVTNETSPCKGEISDNDRCEVSVCHNYCLYGDCTLTSNGLPSCSCKEGFIGLRCEMNVCQDYCLNDGSCTTNSTDMTAVCQCKDGYEGSRCETKIVVVPPIVEESVVQTESVCNCDSWDPIRDPIMMVLGILCGLLCVACAVLVTKVLHLRRRPRIKKRIIVNKNVTPLTARPDQCEITIENCCNMNICETPCFEPRTTIRPTLLDAKPGKEEKRNLISNMEQVDDLF